MREIVLQQLMRKDLKDSQRLMPIPITGSQWCFFFAQGSANSFMMMPSLSIIFALSFLANPLSLLSSSFSVLQFVKALLFLALLPSTFYFLFFCTTNKYHSCLLKTNKLCARTQGSHLTAISLRRCSV